MNSTKQTPPVFFQGKRVFIKINDERITKLAKEALEHAGAIIVTQSPFLADFLISDQPVDFNDPSLVRSRGAKLAARATTNRKIPKLIFVHNILWVTERPLDKKAPYMIVADEKSEYRPAVLLVRQPPKLYLQSFPKGYIISPFTAPPADVESVIQKAQHTNTQAKIIPNEPQGAGYCEICGENFVDPAIHRKSEKHQATTESDKWAEFDELSNEINENAIELMSSPTISPHC